MAIYHASIKAFSRGKGESSIAAAAYRAGLDLADTRNHITHRYSQRKGVAAHFMLAPAGAPAWCSDPVVFWDANEAWESRANARVARELEVSLPHELNAQQRQELALELGQLLVDRYKAVVLAAIHLPSTSGDNRNHHVHLLMSARQVGPDGFGVRAGAEFEARAGKGADEVRRVRELVSARINARLEAAGLADRVDHRSLKVQAMAASRDGDTVRARELSRPPGKHIGRAITAALRRADPVAASLGRAAPSDAQVQMDAALEKFAKAGVLINTPAGHSATAARADRARESDDGMAAAATSRPAFDRLTEKPSLPTARTISACPSAMALHLSRQVRLARSEGKDSEVLNAQSRLIDEWHESLHEILREALRSLQAIPGLRVEQEMTDATDAALLSRVALHGTQRFFFEDSEALVASVVDYAVAVRDPHEKRERLGHAQAKIVSLEIDNVSNRDPRMASARRALTKANASVSNAAKIAQERKIRDARKVMDEARAAMERDYPVSKNPALELVPLDHIDASGAAHRGGSNLRELKPGFPPRSRPSL